MTTKGKDTLKYADGTIEEVDSFDVFLDSIEFEDDTLLCHNGHLFRYNDKENIYIELASESH